MGTTADRRILCVCVCLCARGGGGRGDIVVASSVLMKNALLFFITLATVLPMHDTLWATVPQSIAGRRGTLLCSALLCYASTLPPPPPPLCCDSAGLPCLCPAHGMRPPTVAAASTWGNQLLDFAFASWRLHTPHMNRCYVPVYGRSLTLHYRWWRRWRWPSRRSRAVPRALLDDCRPMQHAAGKKNDDETTSFRAF